MKKHHIVITLAAGTVALLAACSEPTPDISGTYSENTENFLYTYTFSKFDETKYQMVVIEKSLNRPEKNPVIREKIYLYSDSNKFCEEASNSDCFSFDKKQGIRFDGQSEFIKKAD